WIAFISGGERGRGRAHPKKPGLLTEENWLARFFRKNAKKNRGVEARRVDHETRPPPPLQPPAGPGGVFLGVGPQNERHSRAGRLSRLGTVEDHLAAFRDHLLRVIQLFRRDPSGARDRV